MLQHLADTPAAIGRTTVQSLGIEWSHQSSDLVMRRQCPLAQVFLKVALEHAVE
jgi:hypothetical protein